MGVRRRGGGPRERGEILRVVPQRPALGTCDKSVDLGTTARTRFRVRRGFERHAGRQAGGVASHGGRPGLRLVRRHRQGVDRRSRRRRLELHRHRRRERGRTRIHRVVGGVRSGDGSTDGDVFGRSNARRVGGERCVDSNAKARPGHSPHRPRLSSSSSSRYAPLDVRRLHRGGGAGQTVESDALQMRPGQHKLPARSNRWPGSPSRQNCNRGVTYLWTLQICVDNIRAEPSTPRRARSPGPRSLRLLRSTFVSPHSPSVSPALPHLRAGLPNMTVSPLFRFPSGHDRPTISVAWGACGVVAAGGGDNSLRCYAPAPNDPTQWRQIGAVEGRTKTT